MRPGSLLLPLLASTGLVAARSFQHVGKKGGLPHVEKKIPIAERGFSSQPVVRADDGFLNDKTQGT
jgi:hypothetical protein